MALSYKEMMFECVLNNDSSSSLKTIKSKKNTYKNSIKSKKIYKSVSKSLPMKLYNNSNKKLNTVSKSHYKYFTISNIDDFFDNTLSLDEHIINLYKDYKYIKENFDNILKIKKLVNNDLNSELYNLLSRRNILYGINFVLLYNTESYLLLGAQQLSNFIKELKIILKQFEHKIKLPDFIELNLKKIIEFYNKNVKNDEIVINNFKLIPLTENNFLSPTFINIIDIFNKHFKYLLNEYDVKIIGFYVINTKNDLEETTDSQIKKKQNIMKDITNSLATLNYYQKVKFSRFDIFYQYTTQSEKKIVDLNSHFNSEPKVNIIINIFSFFTIDNQILLEYIKTKLLPGGSIILFLTLKTPIKSQLTALVCKLFKKIIITKTTLNTPNMWVLIGKGYIGDNQLMSKMRDVKILNFINDSHMVHLKKCNDFYNNVYNTINKFNNYELLKEINKRYVEIYKWALDNNIKIINIFSDHNKEPKLLNENKIVDYLFPNQKGVDKAQLKLFNVSLYSVTPPYEALQISETIKKILDGFLNYKNSKNITITDGTANVGGNTINFSKNFLNVNTIEINQEVFNALKHNCENIYKLKNIMFHQGDCIDIIPKLKQDVIFIDPPWNGAFYKAYDKLHLYLGKNDVVDVVKEWYNKKLAKLYVIKVPANYDFEYYIGEYKNIYIQQIRNYNIIYLYNE